MININNIHSASYNAFESKIFVVDCTIDIKGVPQEYLNIEYTYGQEKAADLICDAWLINNNISDYVPYEEPFDILRRKQREQIFSKTIDKMNPLWWSSLSEEQTTTIQAWRQAWLDYPSDESLEEPQMDMSIFN